MIGTLIEKELKSIIQSPKFAATFGVCAVLILLSLFIGIQEYRVSVAQYDAARELVNQQLGEVENPWMLGHQVFRRPDPMQIFVSGVTYDIGRSSNIARGTDIKIEQSPYSIDPVFAVFRYLDFAFIVHVVLSLLAIVFTYDSVNGERENGTLKLVLSNSVPRGHYLFSKLVGSWIGLTVPILLSILIGALLLLIYRVPMQTIEWIKLLALVGVSVLYYSFFITAGLFVSSLTRHSSDSFLILLILWVCLVLIVPRGATMAAEQLVSVPSIADLQSQKDRYVMEAGWEQQREVKKIMPWQKITSSMSSEESAEWWKVNRPRFTEIQDSLGEIRKANIAEFNRQLNEGRSNLQAEQERLAFRLSRFSPASTYKLVAMNLCGTNTSMKARYEEKMYQYREAFRIYQDAEIESWQKRWAEVRKAGGVFKNEPLDASGMPRFEPPVENVSQVFQASIFDFGLLSIYTILAFGGAFLAFVRYDVR